MRNPSMVTWIGWLAATAVAALMGCAFAFTTFQTKDEAKSDKSDIVQRLDRIENKLDQALKN